MNEISQLWFDPSHVMARPPSLTPSLKVPLSPSLSQSQKSLSLGVSAQKETPTGGSPFSVTHEMMCTPQPLPHHPSLPLFLSPKSTAPAYREDCSPPCPTSQTIQTLHIYLLSPAVSDVD